MSATCTTCGRPDTNPFRVRDAAGRITGGCVDACHTDRLPSLSETARWHNRSDAKRIRKNASRFWGGKAVR